LFSLSARGAQQQLDAAAFVDPFIGTAGSGNTFPGALVPWGMTSVSPHNDANAPSGYVKSKPFIEGFGHVHLSGAGCPAFGNVILMPTTGQANFDLATWKSPYSNEQAAPGFYQTQLTRYNIAAAMTATQRAAISRYSFPARVASPGDFNNVFIDAAHSLNTADGGRIKIVSPTEVEGVSINGGFCGSKEKQTIYFIARFNAPAASISTHAAATNVIAKNGGGAAGRNDLAVFRFAATTRQVLVKVGVSYVSIDNARANLNAEIPDWDFEGVKNNARTAWNRELNRIEVEGGTPEQKTIFYSGLYHTLVHPSILSDRNDDYPTMGRKGVKRARGYTRYHVYSLWDTYRTVHPLLTLLYPQQQIDMTTTLVEQARESGRLSKWELAGTETGTMVGDPASIVLASTYLKGLRGWDAQGAYDVARKGAMWTQGANPLRPGLRSYLKYGFIPQDYALEKGDGWVWGPVSTTQEYALADSSLSRFARALGKNDDAREFARRGDFWRNLYDAKTGFLRPRLRDGSWQQPFDPLSGEGSMGWGGSGGPGFVEGNAWQYLFFAQHDIKGLSDLMGGEEIFTARLQQSFDNGQFNLSNEPDMAYPYAFTLVNAEAWRTQKLVREQMARHFNTRADGLPGNDDTGTTSAWYVWSALGFYPFDPAADSYQIGTPLFSSVTLHLQHAGAPDTRFVIRARNNSAKNLYVQSAKLNGKPFDSLQLRHADILRGGDLTFEMGPNPSFWAGKPVAPHWTLQLQDVEAIEGQSVSLQARAGGSGTNEYSWSRNGAPIPLPTPITATTNDANASNANASNANASNANASNANASNANGAAVTRDAGAAGAIYRIERARLEDDGALFSVSARNRGSSIQSRAARLRVRLDTTPPVLVAADASRDKPRQARLSFSEPLEAASANDIRNYAMTGDTNVGILSATVEAGGRAVLLTLDKVIAPGAPFQVVARNLRDQARKSNVLGEGRAPLQSGGDGLSGEYFNNIRLEGAAIKRVDSRIDFDWDQRAPLEGIEKDKWSARWTGQIVPPQNAIYTFSTRSDDGIRLWIDDKPIIDGWRDQSALESPSGPIYLESKRRYNIKIEYYDNAYSASARLFWSSPSLPLGVVPQSRLYSSAP